jgi:hypothetical protein
MKLYWKLYKEKKVPYKIQIAHVTAMLIVLETQIKDMENNPNKDETKLSELHTLKENYTLNLNNFSKRQQEEHE